MPKREDIRSILVIGSGPIVIGQAAEFDYSGTQALKALKEDGYRVALINSNPATIMTDPELADATYIEPITSEFLIRVIDKEDIDAILPTVGGQTALNVALELDRVGELERRGIKLIGADAKTIARAEDRQQFREIVSALGLEVPRSVMVRKREDASSALQTIGLPAIFRPSFTLGGTGGGICYNREEFVAAIDVALDASPTSEVLVEESVLGWKEFELEVIRDRADNCIVVCSIENIDPMGIHTGDSVAVAPVQTLTDRDFQRMRRAALDILRAVGVETGGSNVQFAVDPATGRMVVIEMNPRVSRSSALASKATGVPIARLAAKLAVGYTLDEVGNDLLGGNVPASFEPAIDYVVTKFPRFAFEKFRGADRSLTTSMKSVGEVMAIGRSFAESIQKGLCSLEAGYDGFVPQIVRGSTSADRKVNILAHLGEPLPDRLLWVAQGFREGLSTAEIHERSCIDPWFLEQIRSIVSAERAIQANGLPRTASAMRVLKSLGFSDTRLSAISGEPESEVRKLRHALGVVPQFRRVDTVAGEFSSSVAYLYSSYEVSPWPGESDEVRSSDRRKVLVLGSGPNRIGQGIEFDYCCTQASYALKNSGIESIMINCNPETVSTDYDTADRLYFEPLTKEHVLEIAEVESRNGELLGAIVQFGGQTPLRLAAALEESGIPILGTPVSSIDCAEDRFQFSALLAELGMRQPAGGTARNREEARLVAARIGYPAVIRPSYVLGGRAMEIVFDDHDLDVYLDAAIGVSDDLPVWIDTYLNDALEVDVDCIADCRVLPGEVIVAGVLEHIEEAGVHSGDSACVIPPQNLSADMLQAIRDHAIALARALKVVGLINIQLAIKNDEIFVLEANPRASRTVPFVAKATGLDLAKIAASLSVGSTLADWKIQENHLSAGQHVAVKEAVLPFSRFSGVDTILGPEMRSTGEVMGLSNSFAGAFYKSQLAANVVLPSSGQVVISVRDHDKSENRIVRSARLLRNEGFEILATGGTYNALQAAGVDCRLVKKVHQGRPNIVDLVKDGEIALIFNTAAGAQAIEDSKSLRRAALQYGIPYYTTWTGARAATQAICCAMNELAVIPIQTYHHR